jgi:ribosome modulation factor
MALYAAYGSNMDTGQMKFRCPYSPAVGTGWLEGWRVAFGGESIGWEGALATVVEEPVSRVYVVLYDVHERDEARLDDWDGVSMGLYSKIHLRVQTLDGEQLAWTYVLNDYEGGLPSPSYLAAMADAAEKAGAPDDYVRELRLRPCR